MRASVCTNSLFGSRHDIDKIAMMGAYDYNGSNKGKWYSCPCA
jgi:hypothetical protein